MTDPSPRAGFTVGSLAEVERSLLPLLPSVPASLPPPRSGRGFSHPSRGSIFPFPTSLLPPYRHVRPILSLIIYPSSPSVLIPIYRSFCYLTFRVLSMSRGHWPRGYLRKPPSAARCRERFLFFFSSRVEAEFFILRLTMHNDMTFPDAKSRYSIT